MSNDPFGFGAVERAPSPALAFGATLGRLQRALQLGMAEIARGFALVQRSATTLTTAQRELIREAQSIRRYQRRIEEERQIGLTHVQREANRVRLELGIPLAREGVCQ